LCHLALIVVGILLLRLSRGSHTISCHHCGPSTVRSVGIFLRVLGVVSCPSCVYLLLLRRDHGRSSGGLSYGCDWRDCCMRRLRASVAGVASRSL
jgi:hypothetical protein